MFKPRHGSNKCWLISGDSMPWKVSLGWNGESNYGWSLLTGRVRWSTVYATETEALEATKVIKVRNMNRIAKQIDAINRRITSLEKRGR